MLFEVSSASSARVVIDNLYTRLEQFTVSKEGVRFMSVSGTSVWFANMTMQGGQGTVEALSVTTNAAVHISDSTIANFNSTTAPLIRIDRNSSALFERCTIRDISNPEVNGSAVAAGSVGRTRISSSVLIRESALANNTSPFFSLAFVSGGRFYSDTPLLVFRDLFKKETVPAEDAVDAQSGAVAGASFLREEDRPDAQQVVAPPPLPLPPPSPPPPPPPPPALPPQPPTAPPDTPPADPPGGGDGGSGTIGVVGGVLGAGIAVILLAVAVAVFLIRRRSEEPPRPHPPGTPRNLKASAAPPIQDGPEDFGGGQSDTERHSMLVTVTSTTNTSTRIEADNGGPPGAAARPWMPTQPPATPDVESTPDYVPPATAPGASAPPPAAPGSHEAAWQPPEMLLGGPPVAIPTFGSLQSTTSGDWPVYPAGPQYAPPPTPTGSGFGSDHHPPGPGPDAPLIALLTALDTMCAVHAVFFHRYALLSAAERWVGGRGVVQFATIANTHEQVAIKFYMDWSAFERERDVYRVPALKAMMPVPLAVDDNRSLQCRSPHGYVFPPFVIISRGQSLDEWARDFRRVASDSDNFITIFQALMQTAKALQTLHRAGYAHRDIRPTNILSRFRQHDWTLINFSHAAPIGSVAPLPSVLEYAPPENVHSVETGGALAVSAAADVWALGVTAFELLTGERAFRGSNGGPAAPAWRATQDALAGRRPLPWERPTPDKLRKLRGLKASVLQCLVRNPDHRPTSNDLVRWWNDLLDKTRAG